MAKAKTRTVFVCQSCGATHGRWSGQCSACGEWNSIAEEPVLQAASASGPRRIGGRLDVVSLAGKDKPLPRLKTGIKEFDH
ncbi:MAG: DNA repair protein RadA, partial [Alphaproteobacteria bacterium]|nr:DNA repair protein RadA [Alphaproteobacteria bacterium]